MRGREEEKEAAPWKNERHAAPGAKFSIAYFNPSQYVQRELITIQTAHRAAGQANKVCFCLEFNLRLGHISSTLASTQMLK